jgi:hypothetical protein
MSTLSIKEIYVRFENFTCHPEDGGDTFIPNVGPHKIEME